MPEHFPEEQPEVSPHPPLQRIFSEHELQRVETSLKNKHSALFGEQFIDRKFGAKDADFHPDSYFGRLSDRMPERFSPEFHERKSAFLEEEQTH